MTTPRPLWSTGQVAAQRFNRAFPGLQGGRRAGLAPVRAQGEKRRRRSHPAAAYPWLQGPDYEITVPFSLQMGWTTSVLADVGTADSTLLGWLRDGVNLNSGPTSASILDAINLVTFDNWIGYPDDVLVNMTQSSASVSAPVSLADGEDAGVYTPPAAPPGFVLEYEAGASNGSLVGDITVAGDVSAGGDDPYNPGGSLWWTNEGPSPHRTPAHIIANYEQFLTIPEQTSAPFSATLPSADVFGTGEQVGVSMVIHPLSEAMTDTSSAGRNPDPPGTENWNHRIVLTATLPTLTATVRPPRHRFVPVATSGDWTVSTTWSAYVWDAGLFLGSAFSDLDGLPASLPSGCSELHYYVAPPGVDVVTDRRITEPFGDFYLTTLGNVSIVAPDEFATPDAGSHIWVIWFGPSANVSMDPEPSSPPAPLIPASLAENGTG